MKRKDKDLDDGLAAEREVGLDEIRAVLARMRGA